VIIQGAGGARYSDKPGVFRSFSGEALLGERVIWRDHYVPIRVGRIGTIRSRVSNARFSPSAATMAPFDVGRDISAETVPPLTACLRRRFYWRNTAKRQQQEYREMVLPQRIARPSSIAGSAEPADTTRGIITLRLQKYMRVFPRIIH
jgi:hypothetical protein